MYPIVHRLLTASAVAATVVGLAVAAPACSSSGSKGGSGSTVAPEDQVASPADVAQGIDDIQNLNTQAVTLLPTNQDGARKMVDRSYDTWYTIEGAIKQNETSTYLDLEDALGALKNGVDQNDAAKATVGAARFTTLSTTYLNRFPGSGAPSDTLAGAGAGTVAPAP